MGSSERLASSRLQTLARLTDPIAHDTRGALSTLALHHALFMKALEKSAADGSNGAEAPDRQRHWLQVMETERERLRRLVEPLFAQLATGDTDSGPFDAGPLVDAAIGALRPYAARRKVELAGPSVPRPLRTTGRRDLMLQVLNELLLIAVDATAAGGCVTIAFEPHPGGTRLAIASPATGADAERASRAALAAWATFAPDDSNLRVAATHDTGLAIKLAVPPPSAEEARDA